MYVLRVHTMYMYHVDVANCLCKLRLFRLTGICCYYNNNIIIIRLVDCTMLYIRAFNLLVASNMLQLILVVWTVCMYV